MILKLAKCPKYTVYDCFLKPLSCTEEFRNLQFPAVTFGKSFDRCAANGPEEVSFSNPFSYLASNIHPLFQIRILQARRGGGGGGGWLRRVRSHLSQALEVHFFYQRFKTKCRNNINLFLSLFINLFLFLFINLFLFTDCVGIMKKNYERVNEPHVFQ